LYDSNDDSRLSFSDFQNAVLPATDLYLREIALSRPVFRSDQPLSYAVSWALARVFEKEIQAFKNLENKRKDLVERYDWDVHTAFRTIDQERFGYIDPEAIMLFFEESGFILTSKENDALFRRADKDCDGRIDSLEFKKLMHPISGYDRQISPESPAKKNRSPSPRRLESNSTNYASPTRLSKGSQLISDIDYYRYLEEGARLSSGRKYTGYSSTKRSQNTGRLSPRASSPRLSPRNKSPSLRQELTDYRIDSGYRTVRKYDNVDEYRSSPRNIRDSPLSERGSPRSRSPRFRSEVTDYRVSSNYRTIKTYDGESPQLENSLFSADRETKRQRTPPRSTEPNYMSYNQSYSAGKHRSPSRYQQEPTKYREETRYRTVKVFDEHEHEKTTQKNGFQAEERSENNEFPEGESGIKEFQERSKAKGANEEISKKLAFEEPQQEIKAEKEIA